MCGIFGVVLSRDAGITRAETEYLMKQLFLLSESRGKEASGVAAITPESIYVAKYPLPASDIIHFKEYQEIYSRIFPGNGISDPADYQFPVCVIGHSRLVTNGGRQVHMNNQPAIASGLVAIHNGIITNVDALWEEHPQIEKQTDLDTELLLGLIDTYSRESGKLVSGVQQAYEAIEGVASLAVLFENLNNVLLSTNNGSLYLAVNESRTGYIFASERFVLDSLFAKRRLQRFSQDFSISQVRPGTAYLIDLDDFKDQSFTIQSSDQHLISQEVFCPQPRQIIDITSEEIKITNVERIPGDGPYILSPTFQDEYPQRKEAVDQLQRCTRCVLPETMPFIEFDDEGVCNYCRHYQPIGFKGPDALEEELSRYRSQNGEPDCLVTFSGGRDSSYSVHLMKEVFGMNPITYTYDWGMVTDLARRNQMRICGQLGLEHILVSADITKKRSNIRKNVSAWLRQPDLGTIPIFMAGDKQYFYYMNKVAQQTDTRLIILGENLLETTQFKYGFCGIAPSHGSRHTYTLSLLNKFKLAWYYGSRYITNPAYINSSLLDTIGAYLSYYFIPHNYINIYEYIKWDEEQITSTLINQYNWETATDTKNTWRIGDGTASFYNYIYFTLAGLTENDTFRSNQIREGMISRDEALKFISDENEPRYESMQWYCDIIGLDFYDTIEKINSAQTIYEYR